MNYVRSLAKQLASKGIRVNGVAPGPIWTPLQVSGGASQEKLEKFGGMTPMGRPGQPAELASIYVQLAAADASYATGPGLWRGRRRRAALAGPARVFASQLCLACRRSNGAAMSRDAARPGPWQATRSAGA